MATTGWGKVLRKETNAYFRLHIESVGLKYKVIGKIMFSEEIGNSVNTGALLCCFRNIVYKYSQRH